MSGHLIDEIGINPIEEEPRYQFFSEGELKGSGNSVEFAAWLINTCGGVKNFVYENESWKEHYQEEDDVWWREVCKLI